MTHGKRYLQARDRVDLEKEYPLDDAIATLKELPGPKFDETVELAVSTDLDPRQADQSIRGTISLPRGTGKTMRVICFCPEDEVEAVVEAGAVEAGGEELVEKVNEGWMDFDVAVAHPAMMKFVGKLGRLLGPQGLMPSPKSGTVTPDVAQAVSEFAAGKIEYRLDANGNLHIPVGKKSFPAEDLKENIEAFVDQVRRNRPTGARGGFVRRITVCASMSPGIKVDL
ncbi:MAG: 50S ribosomal protein L1 [Planctomycetota bacterium]